MSKISIDEQDARIRAYLIEKGWTPPNPHTIKPIPTKAYLHPTADNCVTTDPTAYKNPRELVEKAAVYDRIDWLEHGVDEWRATALRHRDELVQARVDTQYLNWLEAQGEPGVPWVARPSTTGRGYRLHQDSSASAATPRQAIIEAMTGAST